MRRASLAILLPLPFLLAGCFFPPMFPGSPNIPGETLVPTDPDACADGSLTLDEPGEYRIGECDELTVEGTGVEVIADEVGTATIRGDDNELGTRSAGILRIEGQSNDVEVGAIGLIDIRGDENDIDSSGSIGSLTIRGNRNEVTFSGQLGLSDVEGEGNEVGRS